MKQRIITGVAGALILIAVLLLGSPFIQTAILILSLIAVHELVHAVQLSDKKNLMITSVAATAVMVVVQFFDKSLFLPVLYIYIAALFIIYMTCNKSVEFNDIASVLMITLYVSFMFGHLIYIWDMHNGHMLIWLVFVCAFMTDTFAMFGGKFFGRHKLCPYLSPKKTIEGSLCGVIGCVLCVAVYCTVCSIFFSVHPYYLNALIVGFAASIVSQTGDLAASCIKRQFGIKDYGKIMPGHGGVMDRFDSVLFVAPFVYYALYIFPIFA